MTKSETQKLGNAINEEIGNAMRRHAMNEARQQHEAAIDRLTERAMKRIRRNGTTLTPAAISEAIVKTVNEGLTEPKSPQEIYAEYEQLRSHSIMSPDDQTELGFFYDQNTNELYAGYISNSGINKQWVVEYDADFSFDENLQNLYDKICEDWEYN